MSLLDWFKEYKVMNILTQISACGPILTNFPIVGLRLGWSNSLAWLKMRQQFWEGSEKKEFQSTPKPTHDLWSNSQFREHILSLLFPWPLEAINSKKKNSMPKTYCLLLPKLQDGSCVLWLCRDFLFVQCNPYSPKCSKYITVGTSWNSQGRTWVISISFVATTHLAL